MNENENQSLVSNCCQAKIFNTDYDICPECGEHCEFVDENQDEISGKTIAQLEETQDEF